MRDTIEQHNILLEAGTNEIEILEFYLGEQSFGVNVLKIKQIIQYESANITPLPQANSTVKGTFLFQGISTILVDLNLHVAAPPAQNENLRRICLICELNNTTTAFLIDGVEKIHRLNWGEIQPPPALGGALKDNVTGILILEGRQILILDFESIVNKIGGGSEAFVIAPNLASDNKKQGEREHIKIMAADDSELIRSHLKERLMQSNYSGINIYSNGLSLHNSLLELKRQADAEKKEITEFISIVITDIEMPGMDGLTLCKKIKDEMPSVPVLILSSLINEQIASRCQQVGADAFLSKRDLGKLVQKVDALCL